ncbi:hypothetical protein HWV62_24095 [Athelia sp. TMB]|nr:hypothetical protein HWV62_24095 [Athelia sp. TMB]
MPRRSCDSEYQLALLPPEGVENTDEKDALHSRWVHSPSKRAKFVWGALLASSVSLNVLQAWSAQRTIPDSVAASHPDESHSPAWGVVEYKQRIFSEVTAVPLPWQGPPSDEVDAAWEDLYNFGLTKVPKSDAAKMLNHTVPIPGDESNFAIALDVFHQLHCLNLIRKTLHPEYYPDQAAAHHSRGQGVDHIGHCITSLRESLLCSADITPTVFKWEEAEHKIAPRFDVVHTCRNFDKIRDWAKERHLEEFDREVHVLDDLKIPVIH